MTEFNYYIYTKIIYQLGHFMLGENVSPSYNYSMERTTPHAKINCEYIINLLVGFLKIADNISIRNVSFYRPE